MKSVLLGTVLAATFLAGAVSASSVNTTRNPSGVFGPNDLALKVSISTGNPTTNSDGFDGRFSAGMYHMVGDGGYGDFLSFCVDLQQRLNETTTYTSNPNLLTSAIRSNIDILFSTALGGDTMANVIDTKVEAAGFQVALWEIISDTGSALHLAKGTFKMWGNSAVRQQAISYLRGIRPEASGGDYVITYFENDEYQDVVTGSPSAPRISNVPLPATGILLAFGVGGLFASRRRRKAG